MGRGLGGDADAPLPGLLDGPDGALDAEMGDMDAGAGRLGQTDIPDDHDLLGGGRDPLEPEAAGIAAFVHAPVRAQAFVLAVVDDESAERRRCFEGAAHDAGVPDGRPSSEKATAPARTRAAMSDSSAPLSPRVTAAIGKTLTRALLRASARMNSVTARLSFTGFVLGMQQIVVNPPRAAARDAGPDGLLVFEAGLAEMDVHVDEARGDDESRRVDRPARPIGPEARPGPRRSCRRRSGRPASRPSRTPGRRPGRS